VGEPYQGTVFKAEVHKLPMASALWALNSTLDMIPHTFVPFLASIGHTQSPAQGQM